MMKNINNLQDLRNAKKALKNKMALADQEAKDGFLYSTFNKLFTKVEDNSALQNSPIGNSVNSALNFLSGHAESRFKMGTTGKTVLSIAVAIAAPIIAKKVQEYLEDKF